MTEWVTNSTEGGEAEEGGQGVTVLSVCRDVDRSQMYHSKYCDGRMSLALMIAMLTLGFITVLVNLGVIIRAIKIVRQGHDKPAFFFIGNLALSDFAVGLYVVIAFLLHVTNKSDLWRQKTCMLQIGIAVTACQETIFTIVLISVDKYLYICHGLHYSRMVTRKRVCGALVLSWCLAILIGSLPAMGLHVSWAEACNRCTFAQVISTSFAIIFFVTSVAVPLAVVVALYSILLVLAIKMHKARYGGSYTARESARSSNFRMSFMSKRSRVSFNTTKTSISSSSSTSSSSTSKAGRRRTRRQDMEAYKVELRRRDGVDGVTGGVTGGGLKSSPLAKISESAELIDRTENGGESGGDRSSGGDSSGVELSSPTPPPNPDPDPGHNGVPQGDIPTPESPIPPTKDTTGGDAPTPTASPGPPQTPEEEEEDVGGEEEEEEKKEEEKERHIATQNPYNGITKKKEEEEEEKEDATTTDEDEEGGGQGKGKKEGKWGAMFPSKYMNRVMADTRDKMLFLKKCRAVKTVLLILVSFSATYVPFVVGSLIYSAQKEKRPCLLHLLNTLLYCAVVANSLANPLIYAYGYSQFRVKAERFKGIFAREKKRSYT